MTKAMSWKDLLKTSNQVFAGAGRLARRFIKDNPKRSKEKVFSAWKKYSTGFENYRKNFHVLYRARKQPPLEFQPVADVLNEIGEITLEIFFCLSGDTTIVASYLAQFVKLDKASKAGLRAVKKLRKLSNSELIAIPAEPESVPPENPGLPHNNDGHIRFIRKVGNEIRDQADDMRSREYTYEVIEKQLKNGVKWSEARERLALITGLPKEVIQAVKIILRRELTPETVEDIARDLVMPLEELQRAGDCYKFGESYIPKSVTENASRNSKTKARGRPKASYAVIEKEKELAKKWVLAHQQRKSLVDFSRENGFTLKDFQRLLDRVSHRKRSSN